MHIRIISIAYWEHLLWRPIYLLFFTYCYYYYYYFYFTDIFSTYLRSKWTRTVIRTICISLSVCKRQNEIMQKLIMYRANVITFDRFIQNAFSIRLIIIYRKKYSQFMSNVLNKWGTLGTFTHRWCICLFSSFFPAIALVQCVRNGWVCEFADLSIYLLLFFFCV